MVPVAGVEPARCCHRWILNPVRLPIPSHRQVYFHEIASKTKPWKSEVDLEVDFEKTVFFNFQEPSKIKGFQPLEREAAQRILSPARLPIPSFRQIIERAASRPKRSFIIYEINLKIKCFLTHYSAALSSGISISNSGSHFPSQRFLALKRTLPS